MTNALPLSNPAVLEELTRRMVTREDGSVIFTDDHGAAILDLDREGVPYSDAKGAARWLYQHRRDLWAAEAPAQSKTSPSAPTTAGEIMVAVRHGLMSSADASAALAKMTGSSTSKAHVSTVPTKFKTLTEAMVAMKRNEPGAEAAVRAFTQ